jgi:hypothetical protein
MKLDSDRVVAVSAMFIGVCSLFLTVYQTHLTRQAQSASVLPYLAVGITSNSEGVYVTLRNDGVGPARIEDMRVTARGKDHLVDPYDFYLQTKPSAAKSGALAVDRVVPGRLVPAGATIQMLGVGGPEREGMLADLLRLFALADVPHAWLESMNALGTDKAVIVVTYSSVYGDRWRVRSDQHVPQPF